jgi:polysaccharide biosynthesis transport protein
VLTGALRSRHQTQQARMFFDDPIPKKANLKPKLRLAGDVRASERASGAGSARERLANARYQKENSISLLDRIDAMDRANASRQAHNDEEPQSSPADFSYANSDNQFQQSTVENQAPAQSNNAPIWNANQGDAAPLVHPVYVINAVRKWRNVILATTVLGGLIGAAVAVSTPKSYYSSTGILIDPRNFKVVENDINPDVFLSEASLAIVDSQLNIIRSPIVMDQVVTKLGLEKDAEFNGTKAGLLSPLKGFLEILFGGKTEGSTFGTAIKNVNAKTEAKRQPGTFVVNIGAFSEDPEKAALIANTIVDVYMAERANDRTTTADRTSDSMQARLPELKKQVEVAENKAAKFKAENDLFDAQGRLIGDEEILRINDQLTAARSATITLNARADSAKSVTIDGLLAGGLPEEINSNALNSLRAQYTTSQQRYDGLVTKLGPMHPDLQQASQESASLRASIDAEIKRIRSSIQTELRRAVQTEQALAASLAQMKVRLASSGDAIVKLREIEREAASARTVYEQFLLRAQETGEQGTIDSTNVKRTNIAKASQDSVGASRKLILLAGLIGGFVFGLGLAILKGIFDALKIQYGSNFGTAQTIPTAPNPTSSPRKRTIRGAFQPVEPTEKRFASDQNQWATLGSHARHEEPSQQYPTPNVSTPTVTQTAPTAPHQQAPLAAPVMPNIQYVPVPVQTPMPIYAPQQPMFMPQMQQPFFVPQQVMMPHYGQPQMMMPQPMIQQPVWQQPVAAAPLAPQAPEPAAPVVAPQPVSSIQQKPLPQNAQLDDIQESLSDMRAELMNLARQRRFG